AGDGWGKLKHADRYSMLVELLLLAALIAALGAAARPLVSGHFATLFWGGLIGLGLLLPLALDLLGTRARALGALAAAPVLRRRLAAPDRRRGARRQRHGDPGPGPAGARRRTAAARRGLGSRRHRAGRAAAGARSHRVGRRRAGERPWRRRGGVPGRREPAAG